MARFCSKCGAPIEDEKTKFCPKCGTPLNGGETLPPKKKNNKKKIIIGIVGVIFVIFLIGSCAGGSNSSNSSSSSASTTSTNSSSNKQENKQIEYTETDAAAMMSALKDNPAAASKSYKGKDLKIVNAIVTNIDSDGKYFTINIPKGHTGLSRIRCNLKNDDVKDQITSVKMHSPVTVYGHVSDVGETLGYTINTKKIEVPKQ